MKGLQVIVCPDQDQGQAQIETESVLQMQGRWSFCKGLSYIQGRKGIRATPSDA